MEDEVKEKIERVKKVKGVTLTLKGIPTKVHNRVKAYQKKISYERDKKFTVKSAYIEFLKEHAKS